MTIGPREEKEFLEALKSGNLSAFEKILFRYEKAIFNYIYRMTSQKQDAEDLTQETFVKLYKNIHNIDTEKNFKSWLYKIATNTVYDWFRRKQAAPEIFPIDEPTLQIETIDNKNAYYYAGDKKAIEEALNKIKPVYKSTLLLFYREDISYKEIAKIMGVPINTVKTYLRRAKQALKEKLDNGQISNQY